jgi:hypothetical protein
MMIMTMTMVTTTTTTTGIIASMLTTIWSL